MLTRTGQLIVICTLFIFLTPAAGMNLTASTDIPVHTGESLRHSLDFSPLSPLFRIYALQYNYYLTPGDELILGGAYTNLQWDFGETNAATLILGYRRYLWKNLHIEYQLWPDYDRFYEKKEGKIYPGFDLWNEFRLGYRVDFTAMNQPLYLNFQWPFGFGLFDANKPESFKQHEEENPYFYFPPMFFPGFRF